ncbi:MAG TPA: histidine triad nucleotide-binding protein [Gemmatimonadota bacterium]|nr:histidine triad nucleotide-binding protein [Gemmatimonadota bacterium]
MSDCVFCGIVSGEIDADVVAEAEDWIAFRDLRPQAPVHVLVVPREHVPTLNDLSPDHDALVGRLVRAGASVAASEGIADEGWRLVVNCNAGAGQTVFHVHAHVLGGRPLGWPPG